MNDRPFSLLQQPVLSSRDSQWQDIQLALYRLPPCEIPRHRSPDHILCINLGNSVILEQCVDGLSGVGRSTWGDMSFYEAGCWQTFQWDRKTEFLQLYFKPKFWQRVSVEIGLDDRFSVKSILNKPDPLVLQLALAMKNSLENGTGSQLYADSLAHTLAVHLLNQSSCDRIRHKAGGLSQHQIRQVKEYVRDRLETDLSLKELASCAALSQHHFARSFKRSTGMTPHQYVIQQRVERAKELLKQSNLSVTEIALSCGFAHQGHLSRHFKRVFGLSPTAFRKNC